MVKCGRQRARRDQSGQAVMEYVLLLVFVTTAFMIVRNGLDRMGLMKQIMRPLQQDFAMTYKYGHPKAKGFDEGGPEKHPRARGGDNFRLFISPRGGR